MSTVSRPASVKKRNPVTRAVFFVLGLICLALIPISTTLPVLPTFDLVLLAAFFFSMSSERMHSWMLNHKWFGPMLRGYREYGLTMKMKWTATAGIVGSITVSGVFLTDNIWVRLVLVLLAVWGVWFVHSRPTRDPATLD